MKQGVFDENDILMLRKLETVRQHFELYDSEFRGLECNFIGKGYSYGGFTIDDSNDFEHLIKGDFIEYKSPIVYPTEFDGQKVYQMSDWEGDFSTCFKPGDLFTVEVAEYFLEVLPPANWSNVFVQVGEPHDHRPDKNGVYKPTYASFIAIKGTFGDTNSIWKYCGNCFKGEMEEFRG
jgi:hypothetical protein